MKVILEVKGVKRRQPMLNVSANQLLLLDQKNFGDLKKRLRDEIGKETETFLMVGAAEEALMTPDYETDKEGNKIRDQLGRWIAKPFSDGIKTARIRNRILRTVDAAVEKAEESGEYPCTVSISLKPEDAIYLADSMMRYCNNYILGGEHIVEMYDYFSDLKAKAVSEKEKSETDN